MLIAAQDQNLTRQYQIAFIDDDAVTQNPWASAIYARSRQFGFRHRAYSGPERN
jgi:TorA maturation chaperone TorD